MWSLSASPDPLAAIWGLLLREGRRGNGGEGGQKGKEERREGRRERPQPDFLATPLCAGVT